MDWIPFISAALGGAVAIATAWLTNWWQFRRAREDRADERDRDSTEYNRRRLEAEHEQVRVEVMTIAEAVANIRRLAALARYRGGENLLPSLEHEHLNSDEKGEWVQWVARAETSAQALSLMDGDLGSNAQDVRRGLNASSPGQYPMWTEDGGLDNLLARSRNYLNSAATPAARDAGPGLQPLQ